MRSALATRSYPEVLAVLLVAEWLYGDWAARAGDPTDGPPKQSTPNGSVSTTTRSTTRG